VQLTKASAVHAVFAIVTTVFARTDIMSSSSHRTLPRRPWRYAAPLAAAIRGGSGGSVVGGGVYRVWFGTFSGTLGQGRGFCGFVILEAGCKPLVGRGPLEHGLDRVEIVGAVPVVTMRLFSCGEV